MKMALMTCFSFLLLVNFAFAGVIDEDIKDLGRVIKITVDGKTYEGGFAVDSGSEAFYFSPEEYVQIKVERPYKSEGYEVQLLIEEEVFTFKVMGDASTKIYAGTREAVKTIRSMSRDGGIEYWSHYEVTGPKRPASLKLELPLENRPAISELVTVTGPLEFSPCDGCEHGDQIFVDDGKMRVNMVRLNWGPYYVEDCEGELHRLLAQLFYDEYERTGLNVPFTYRGLINANTSDLLEVIGDFWFADQREGHVYIGHTTHVPVARFFDLLIFRIADAMDVEPHEIWNDVLARGNFTTLKNDVLTFVYNDIMVRTDLKTARTQVIAD